MGDEKIPSWLFELEPEDYEFMHRFILASGSLKKIAKEYGVSYPTIRLRLDRLIQKVSVKSKSEGYVGLIKDLALEDEISFEAAKKLIAAYRKERK
ncbi:DUF2089 family protein [Streptococcus chenjunshii]|uniref:DUF2089 family protein n=1 Tax=Streptococcus chenjunshii TaxID=2173853 RepID=A0A372KKW2_9STRE|nr:DUF2089 family protein [Streptococcus chenjunshii]AXQ79368.1 DUF2089 family protein [Streptococcus chenjunshii]RFU50576.1 DUF2089 family protein [Streptococcus chenjunshii]RFU52929.1 DUF2089 family protein [Streptococcus chenjunshii]